MLSAAATWIVLGRTLYSKYSSIRQQAIDKLRTEHELHGQTSVPYCHDAFHDGIRVLPAVLQWHQHLRNSVRKSDTITSRILDLVDSSLLIEHADRRLTSELLCQRLDDILVEAKNAHRSLVDERVLTTETGEINEYLLKLSLDTPTNQYLTSDVEDQMSRPIRTSNSNTLVPPMDGNGSSGRTITPSRRVRKSELLKLQPNHAATRGQVSKTNSKMFSIQDRDDQAGGPSQPIADSKEVKSPQLPTGITSLDTKGKGHELPPVSEKVEPEEGEPRPDINTRESFPPGSTAIEQEYERLEMLYSRSSSRWILSRKIPKDGHLEKFIVNRDIVSRNTKSYQLQCG